MAKFGKPFSFGIKSGYAGRPLKGLLASAERFNRPSTEGLSDAERKALDDRQREEDDRRKRLLEQQRRRSRVALGVQGGSRTLLFGTYSGSDTQLGGKTAIGGP